MIGALRLALLIALIALWEGAARLASDTILPTPAQSAAAALRRWSEGRLVAALGDSLAVYLGGPVAVLVYALAAFILLGIVLLGLGHDAKTFVVLLGAVMPMLLNTYAGVLPADGEQVGMTRATGAGRGRVFRHVVLPCAVPFLVMGLRLGAAIRLINAVVAERYTAVRGLGGRLAFYGNTFRMAGSFIIVLMLSLICVVVTKGLRRLEARFGRWRGSRT